MKWTWLVRFLVVISESIGADVILRDILATNLAAERHGYPALIIGHISIVAVIKECCRAKLLLKLIIETGSAARHDSIRSIR